jgi:hypothetical protein
MRITVFFLLFLIFPLLSRAQTPLRQGEVSGPIEPAVPSDGLLFSGTGDAAIARRYVEWARKEASAGRTVEALASLERGADYAGVSSDVSYLLGFLRSVAGLSRFSVLEACRRALETMRWEQYGPEDTRLLEAKTLTELRRFEEALMVLDHCDAERYVVQYRRLTALKGLAQSRIGAEAELLKIMASTMDRFPRETGPVRLLFEYAVRGKPKDNLRPLIDLALRRLPLLIDSDPELAYMAVPFIRNREEARRYTASYRVVRIANPASLPAALELGIINGTQAVEELFGSASGSDSASGPVRARPLDRDLIVNVNALLGSENERNYLKRNLLQFSGVITEDGDYDGIIEAWTTYRNGMITEYRYDADQDGEADLIITFAQGLPVQAEIILAFDENSGRVSLLAGGYRAPPDSAQPRKALLRWERYPAVLDTELEGKRYIPRPLDYFFTPIRFAPLVYGGPDYPNREFLLNGGILPVLTERSLLSFSYILEQPNVEFPGSTERIELSGGIPVKSTVYLRGRKVSETEFHQGRPSIQNLDLDLDGRMETVRRFDSEGLVSSESDWDGDGIYEYAEIRQSDGSMKKFWDFDKDGIRETEHE